jgi:NCAIR mutase (PurE)-related protein
MEGNSMKDDLADIKLILEAYKNGSLPLGEAAKKLADDSFEDLGFARLDHARKARQGFPEVIYCQGKSVEQVAEIFTHLAERGGNILASRASEAMYLAIKKTQPLAIYHKEAGLVYLARELPPPDEPRYIAVVTAGTSDIPVAEEAAITAELMGSRVERIFDVGVAGIHRLFANLDVIRAANVSIVVAGMEGALASVVGGLVEKPVIAVPTSIGYGASFGGLAALLSMLNSCAAGVGVVNIDNGFGAGRLAALINKMR